MAEVRKGTVKFFNAAKGFGFITDDETGEEIYVNARDIKDGREKTIIVPSLDTGDCVEFVSVVDERKKDKNKCADVALVKCDQSPDKSSDVDTTDDNAESGETD